MTNNLTFIKNNDVFTDSLVIANDINYEHRAIVKHFKTYKERFERRGNLSTLSAKIKEGAGRPTTIYLLNETQAVFLVTLLDNTDEVLDFKERLAVSFTTMRHILCQRQTAEWQEIRQQGKQARLQETDALQQLVAYAKAQGSKNADKLFMSYSKLVKGLTGYNKRDTASADTLQLVSFMERLLPGIWSQEMQQDTYYKDIFQRAKAELQSIRDMWCLPTLQVNTVPMLQH